MRAAASDRICWIAGAGFLVAVLLWTIAGPGTGSAHADVPVYAGVMSFPPIEDVSGPEEYSWKVPLAGNQELRQVDSQRVQVYYESGHPAFTISAEAAHDAIGVNVPTTLETIGEDVITLTVHHRAGNPEAGGAPFNYPVINGTGWEGGFQTSIVQVPPVEALSTEPFESDHCVVPVLKGKSLRASRRQLARSDCSLGRVIRKGISGRGVKVLGQNPRAGTMLRPGGSVSVKIGR